jgi:hypothetical protein
VRGVVLSVEGAIGGRHEADQTSRVPVRESLEALENALAYTPVFAGIAKPPQQMPARLTGAG